MPSRNRARCCVSHWCSVMAQFTAVTDPLCSCFMLVKYIHVLCDTLCINVYTVQVAIYITNLSNKRIYIIISCQTERERRFLGLCCSCCERAVTETLQSNN